MPPSLKLKRGASLLLHAVCTQDDGTPIDLTSVQIMSSVADTSGDLVDSLTVTMTTPTAGMFDISASNSATAGWPIGRLSCDVCYVQSGTVIYSDGFSIIVEQPVTPPPALNP